MLGSNKVRELRPNQTDSKEALDPTPASFGSRSLGFLFFNIGITLVGILVAVFLTLAILVYGMFFYDQNNENKRSESISTAEETQIAIRATLEALKSAGFLPFERKKPVDLPETTPNPTPSANDDTKQVQPVTGKKSVDAIPKNPPVKIQEDISSKEDTVNKPTTKPTGTQGLQNSVEEENTLVSSLLMKYPKYKELINKCYKDNGILLSFRRGKNINVRKTPDWDKSNKNSIHKINKHSTNDLACYIDKTHIQDIPRSSEFWTSILFAKIDSVKKGHVRRDVLNNTETIINFRSF